MTLTDLIFSIKAKGSRLILKTITYMGLIFFTIVSGYPLIWMLFGSLKSQGELYRNIWLWPENFVFSNYVNAWIHAGIGAATRNSLIVTGTSVVLVVMIGSIAAYAFAKMRFPGSNLILSLLILTMMIRPVYTSVELFRLTKSLGIIDKYPGLILPNVATSLPLALALFTTYFRSIPNELEDAARIDGANWFTLYLEIILPLSGPVISAVVIFTFLDAYNELFMALILLKGAGNQTIPVALASIIGQFYKDYPELFAGLSASLAPIILVYLIFQRKFISGMLSGAIKG